MSEQDLINDTFCISWIISLPRTDGSMRVCKQLMHPSVGATNDKEHGGQELKTEDGNRKFKQQRP